MSHAQGGLPDVPELFNVPTPAQTPPAGVLRNVGAYPSNITGPTITRLADGKVLVYGFDPVDWALRDQSGRQAVTLRNRWKVGYAGGFCDMPKFGNAGGPSAYTKLSLWNSKAPTWEHAPKLHQPRIYHSATLMRDGSVLLIGGEGDPALPPPGQPVLASVERYHGNTVTVLLYCTRHAPSIPPRC